MTMKALVYTGTQEVEYRDEDKPVPGPNQALIEVAATAICGSDMHAYHGLDERRVPPLILGHEVAGKLVIGASHLVGKHVVINPLITCGKCSPCLSGRANLCSEREIIGMRLEGAYAQYLVIDETNLLIPPPNLEPWVACLTEPTATALHAVALVERIGYRPLSEQRCLVIGGGAIGLLTALILAAKGCNNIDLAETNALRRHTIEQQNVARVFDPSKEAVPHAQGYDVVFDCVGAGVTRAMASAQVVAGGILSHVGLQNSHEGLDIRRITLQEITLLGNYCYTQADMQAALDMLAGKRLGDLKWVQLRPLSEGAEAFSDLHHGRAAAAKIVLQPDHCM